MSGAKPLIGKLALIGIGLIGSSVARAAREAGLVGEIAASAATDGSLETAARLGIVDHTDLDPAKVVAGADLVLLCTPVGAYRSVTEKFAGALKPGAIVSDVGSVKAVVKKDLAGLIPEGVHLIPGHPVAGTEKSGPEAGFAELFHGRWAILTPDRDVDADALETLKAFWQGLGSRIEMMDAEHHDLVLAITSHVPHLIAYNIVGTASDLETVTESEVIKYSAGGFRDFTRIAASDPTMWRDVFLSNSEAVLEMLARFSEDLTALRRAIRWKDGEALHALFTRTREIRRSIIDAGQDTAAPDFGREH